MQIISANALFAKLTPFWKQVYFLCAEVWGRLMLVYLKWPGKNMFDGYRWFQYCHCESKQNLQSLNWLNLQIISAIALPAKLTPFWKQVYFLCAEEWGRLMLLYLGWSEKKSMMVTDSLNTVNTSQNKTCIVLIDWICKLFLPMHSPRSWHVFQNEVLSVVQWGQVD